jgi:hypothetical protein
LFGDTGGAECSTHDESRGGAAYDLDETGALVQAPRSEEHEVVVASYRLVDRVGLDQPNALLARPPNRRPEKPVWTL